MNQKTHIEFYKSLGHLFYAIAAIDNVIKDEEINTLKAIIESDWLASNEATNYILETFIQLQHIKSTNPEDSFQRFIDFRSTHQTLFNNTLNSKIINTAAAIANSYAKQNKSELIALAKLNIELKKEQS
ncbi:hypothetical protein [Winogradskyella sediminis]|uniref:hypothetical protein n=1 Tax=Winogradskyella sediminis TaxID=1382466 RepID=UPI000E2441C5|nr:hypothetical protein [Winogradskyella sediminis]REG87513.1 hypothetical protein C8N41_102351 [Winogradskyella sediminis]